MVSLGLVSSDKGKAGQGSKYLMRFFEIATAKPLTPQQARIRSLQQGVESARARLQAERDRQRKERDLARQRRLKLSPAVSP